MQNPKFFTSRIENSYFTVNYSVCSSGKNSKVVDHSNHRENKSQNQNVENMQSFHTKLCIMQ